MGIFPKSKITADGNCRNYLTFRSQFDSKNHMLKLLRRFENAALGSAYLTGLDLLARARVLLLFYLLVLAELTILINLPFQFYRGDTLEIVRTTLYGLLIFVLYFYLITSKDIKRVSIFLILVGTINVISNVYFVMGSTDIGMLQLSLVITLFSFFMIGTGAGLLVAAATYVPFLLFDYFDLKSFFGNYFEYQPWSKEEMVSTMVVISAMMLFIIWHFQNAFKRYAVELQNSLQVQEDLNVALEDARLEAEASSRAKSNFLSVMSHEIRTPMNGIIGITELMQEQAVEPQQKEYLELLKFSADNLLSMLNNVLDYNRLESGRMELEHIAFQPYTLFKNLLAGFQPMADEKQLELLLVADELPPRVWGDPTKITQVLINLIGNAVKFTNFGRVELVIRDKGNHHYLFEIRDTGVGIPLDKQQVIFDSFSQASADVSRKFGGSGLGLAIVKRLLELMGTDIKLMSTIGKGSSFSFVLHLTPAPEVEKEKKAGNPYEGNLEGLKILVVEDNAINATVLMGLLKRWKVHHSWAAGGLEALELLRVDTFNMVLMDLHMPEMDGFETIRRARAMGIFIPILAITADTQPESFDKARRAGANGCIVKPYAAQELRIAIEEALDRTIRV